MDCLIKEIESFIFTSPAIPSTKARYRKNLGEFAQYLKEKGNFDLEELHLETIYELVDRSGKIIALKPIDEDLIDQYFFSNVDKGYRWLFDNRCTLGSFFKYLEKNYDFPNLSTTLEFNIQKYKPDRQPPRIYGRHDILRLLQSICKNSMNLRRDLLLFLLLISTGCRISEILQLHVKDVDHYEDMLHIWMSKTKRSRTVVLRKGFGECIFLYCSYYNLKEADFIFTNEKNVPLRTDEVRMLLHTFSKCAGLPLVRIHSLRHTFATLMFEQDCEIQVIQQLLGHTSVQSTENLCTP
ncbi:UNVERIFIED_CONTAM: integrase/recombinase XerD [Brevibacillus sp. OAP136]